MVLPKSLAAQSFDFDTGNSAVDVIIPTIAPQIFQFVSQSGGDATLILRITTLINNAWFDATAPYHPTAVGVYSRLGRMPADQSFTNANINIAMFYAAKQVMDSLLPAQSEVWRQMLAGVGLDPDDNTGDLTSPIGLGNVAGAAVVTGRQNDGMNQLGNEDRLNNPMPYMDYTGYKPVNTAYRLRNPSRWQPDIQRQGMGIYKIQQFVTPQFALVEPYSYHNPGDFSVPRPVASNHRNHRNHRKRRKYKRQADEVLEASANLTDEQKIKAEFFDDKIASLGFSAVFAALSQGLSLLEFIHLDFVANMAAHDAGIFVWQEKRRFDAVRPYSAIRFLYRDHPVLAWGGPGRGAEYLPANEWKSYLEEADHPEYPSASACFCAAHTQSARVLLGTDDLFYQVSYPAGSSKIEPGVTPAADLTVSFDNWTDFNDDCGESRVWAGVHFPAAVEASQEVCNIFGDLAIDYLNSLLDGTAPERPPAVGRR